MKNQFEPGLNSPEFMIMARSKSYLSACEKIQEAFYWNFMISTRNLRRASVLKVS